MKISDKLILLFNNTIAKIKTTYNNHISRKLKEEDYFKTYLNFLNNSIYFSRYETTVNNIKITGKYLNEKVNYWNSNTGSIASAIRLTLYVFSVIQYMNLCIHQSLQIILKTLIKIILNIYR